MAPSHTRRRGRRYRFYRTATALKLCHVACPIRAVPAGEVEAAVINQIGVLLRAPEVVVRVWRAAQLDGKTIAEGAVVEALQRLSEAAQGRVTRNMTMSAPRLWRATPARWRRSGPGH